jgi:hypothetical protein
MGANKSKLFILLESLCKAAHANRPVLKVPAKNVPGIERKDHTWGKEHGINRIGLRLVLAPSRSILAALACLTCAHHEAISPATIRYQILTVDRISGSQVTEISGSERRFFFEYNDRGRGPRLSTRMVLHSDGTPVLVETTGQTYLKANFEERFSNRDGKAIWQSNVDSGEKVLSEPAFYVSANPVPEEVALLARALLASPQHRLALLPQGEARIQKIDEVEIGAPGRTRKVVQYAVEGLRLASAFIWLDQDQNFFGQVSPWRSIIREGWNDAIPTLLAADRRARAEQSAAIANSHGRPLGRSWVLRGGKVFDSERGVLLEGVSVVGSENRIIAVGPENRLQIPPGAAVLDTTGKVLLPGLWDMHSHLSETDGPLYIACGVTTVRDLGNDIEALLELKQRYDLGKATGPRVVPAGFLDGPGPFAGPTGILVDTEEAAKAAVDRYVQLKYSQIKIYSSIKPSLVPAIVERSHAHGLRVSGHVPFGMNAEDAVRAGFDELQHINFVFLNFLADRKLDTRTPLRFTHVAEHATELDFESPRVRSFIALLKQRAVVVDPTLAIFEEQFTTRKQVAPAYRGVAERLPPISRRALMGNGLPGPEGKEKDYRDSFRALHRMVATLLREGVPIVAGTDAELGGFVLQRELELYVEAGLTPAAALQLATIRAATLMKMGDELGSIGPGKLADLIVVDGDPTRRISEIRRVEKVIKNGVLYDSAQLERAVGLSSREASSFRGN